MQMHYVKILHFFLGVLLFWLQILLLADKTCG